jgi:hypothetical protein
MAYSPKYVELSDVPMAGVDDDYEDPAKKDALEYAESKLETDINEGGSLEENEVQSSHRSAVKALATHILTHEAEDAASTKLGDLTSSGESILSYSSHWLSLYEDLRDSITQADDDEGSDSRDRSIHTTAG